MKILKRGLAVSACVMMMFSMVGCSDKNGGSNGSNTPQNVVDIRTRKMYNQQQALLLFTTENPAGSIISVSLKPVKDKNTNEEKYFYTVDGTNRKGIRRVYFIDASNGKIVKKEDKGLLDKTSITGFIDFVPVMDIDKAGLEATKYLKDKDINQIVSYTLYSEGGKNVYEIVFTNGSDSNPKKETVMIDGITGKQIANQDDQSSDSNQSSDSDDNN